MNIQDIPMKRELKKTDFKQFRVLAEAVPKTAISPLTWATVNPQSHSLDEAEAKKYIAELFAGELKLPSAAAFPFMKVWDTKYITPWKAMLRDWSTVLTARLVTEYGEWARYWYWAASEGGGGGPVHSWCCNDHSISTNEETQERVTKALLEWRHWLEELATIFATYNLSSYKLDERQWAALVSELITRVMEITETEDAWYNHCEIVLEWALEYAGFTAEAERKKIIESSLDGEWQSWVPISDDQIKNTAHALAKTVTTKN